MIDPHDESERRPDTTPDATPAAKEQRTPVESGSDAPSGAAPGVASPSFGQGPIATRRRPDSPRRVRNGLRVRLRVGEESIAWPASAWFDLLTDGVPGAVRDEGIAYARAGQIVAFGVRIPETEGEPVRVEATVQGRAPRPYETVIEIPAWSQRQWQPIIHQMAKEAIYVAKLLGGEIPPTVDDLMQSMGRTLLPTDRKEIVFRCTCALDTPCKHHVAVACLLAERLVESPLLALTVRGMAGEEVVHRLQEARSLQTHGLATAHAPSPLRTAGSVSGMGRNFHASLLDFWRPGPQLSELDRIDGPEHVPHALLRRLGPSPIKGRFPLVGLLASIYDSMRSAAQEISRRNE